jgi:hypothetical protein
LTKCGIKAGYFSFYTGHDNGKIGTYTGSFELFCPIFEELFKLGARL